ncbi:MAG: hypothetical protein P8I92_04885 [Schleiferiaceae bacterium]|nr:hypothetical protein [Schleiferiaceae bacterium]
MSLLLLFVLLRLWLIPNVIRIRGKELAGKHTTMVQFLAHDMMKTNIRLMYELGALVVFA